MIEMETFLGHFFRENYERWLKSIPLVSSGININRVEVYILNRTNNSESLRNFVAFTDLGEGKNILSQNNIFVGSGNNGPADNGANVLFQNLSANNNLRNVDLVDDILLVNLIYQKQLISKRLPLQEKN